MARRHSRSSPPPSSPPPPPTASKLSKFLPKASRDRSKSVTETVISASSPISVSSSGSSIHTTAEASTSRIATHARRLSRFGGGGKGKDDKPTGLPGDADSDRGSFDDAPVIIEPSDMPRQRQRGDRPYMAAPELQSSTSMYSTSPNARISDLPTRLSGWFSHTFSSSTNDLSLPSLIQQTNTRTTSPTKGKNSALLTAAKHGKGHLDRAMRFILDSDATPDKSTDPIWILGVKHAGYEPPPVNNPPGRRPSLDSQRLQSSASSMNSQFSQSQSPASEKHPGQDWAPEFYADFTSRIWLTYRNQFAPIRDSTLSTLESDQTREPCTEMSSPSPKSRRWFGGEKGWTTDTGWGCMLRTGQTLLANALLHLHLGRDWRRPPYPLYTEDYATYVQIITWFLDSPLPQAPFSVHRMALAGKDLGKDVGQWFGPSTAAGAIKRLVQAFPDAGLGVAVASDGALYQTDVYSASYVDVGSPRNVRKLRWGGRAVLVLFGIRLGINGVNPIYYDTIKGLFEIPQSVGIAGGRPSSSYYFMGVQGDNLIYLDPHHARPAIPLRPLPEADEGNQHGFRRWDRENTPEDASSRRVPGAMSASSPPGSFPGHHYRTPTSPSSVRTHSSTFSYHAPVSPSPLQHQLSSSSGNSASSGSQHPARWQNATVGAHVASSSSDLDPRELGAAGAVGGTGGNGGTMGGNGGAMAGETGAELDPLSLHYINAYSPAELKTFHCDRVRKMPLSGLDPSMLLGFLCQDEEDWIDFRHRITDLMHRNKTIFAIQDEPPNWSEENVGLESIYDEDDEDELAETEDGDEADRFFDTRSASGSPAGSSARKGSEVDTEEDPIGPITPGPNSTFEVHKHGKEAEREKREPEPEPEDDFEDLGRDDGEDGVDDDDDEDWVDPGMPTPGPTQVQFFPSSNPAGEPPELERPQPSQRQSPSRHETLKARSGSAGSEGRLKEKKSKKQSSSSSRKDKERSGSTSTSPSPPAQGQGQHFPFPSSMEESFHDETGERLANRMNNARARDGGRTESGGVKAIIAEDGVDYSR
ncbi:hypothetical protein CONPUDRAFT_111807 [Coniophora puteana RWD-64-598 SS2]|uniref:Autophagy-related protein 4 n=1 Tax=Coniophora puteana (strain RWD-64-598) TaxID=741705 RepID=A0A5M3M9V1_CONPW|nr:uncharacterized protein CONPUDRAFT_111807 [Coniophora puteana RWD-64-598 SS2]EIW75969.1 hypothetical protein CONPUDRAFT_111807 [Coniophora puteana RWD-64-598 SS2]